MSSWSSYKIELIGTGEQAGTWGTTTNNNFQYAIEQAIGGYVTQALTTTSTTLSLTNTNALQNARALFIQFTGSPGAGATVVLPSIQKLYFIKNAITTYDLIVKTSTSATVTVPNGKTACIYVNGTDVIGTNDWLPSLATTTITASGAVTVSGALTANTNTTLGTSGTAVTGVSYTISGTNAVFSSGFSLASAFSVGDYVTVDFASGSGVDGRYQVASSPTPTTTTFALVGAVPSGSTTGPGSFYKSNRITNYADFYTAGGTGTSGQILTSQGTDQPPTWSSLTSVSSLTISGALTANGNSTFGSTAVTSGTYSRSLATITVTATAHGFSTGQVLYLNFTTGVATSGIYSITVVNANTFTVTDTVNTTGSSSGNVTITKYNNSFTLQSPVTSFGGNGTVGQFFTSQGDGAPPQWTTLSSISNLSVTGNLTVAGSTTNNGTTTNNGNTTIGSTTASTATYSRSSATITITSTAHGFSTGQVLYLNFTTGVATSGIYSITRVDDNTFRVTDTVNTTGSSSGNVSITKYNNTFSVNSPIVLPTEFGSSGTSGYVLVSQGINAPPKWSDAASAISSLSLSGTLTVAGASTFNGNSSFGSTTAISGSFSYTKTTTAVTISGSGFNFSASDYVWIVFSGGSMSGLDGVYQLATATSTQLTFSYSSSGTTGGTVTSITKYNNNVTLQAPISAFNGYGNSAQFLSSQGSNAPPKWLTLAGGGSVTVSTSGSTTTISTSTQTSAALYVITGATYAYATDATYTITKVSHGIPAGAYVSLVFSASSGSAPPNGNYLVSNVTANTFDISASAIAGDAGSCATGTALQFGSSYNLSIPTWAKKITVMFVGVSTSSTGTKIIQIGTGGSPETSGYLGAGGQTSGSAAATTNYTTGFGIRSSTAADILHGSVDISFASANYWVANGVVSKSDAAVSYQTSGSKSLAGALDTVVVTTTGTDVFDSGFVALQYQ